MGIVKELVFGIMSIASNFLSYAQIIITIEMIIFLSISSYHYIGSKNPLTKKRAFVNDLYSFRG